MTAELDAKLAQAIDQRSVERVYAYLVAVSEKERKAAFPGVVAYTKEALRDWSGGVDAVAGLALLGCAPTAKRAMSAINRGSLRWDRRAIPRRLALDLLVRRDLLWLGELARLWAETSSLASVDEWLLVDGIAGAAGIDIPRTQGFTRGWIAWVRSEADSYDAITTGGYARELLPLLFEHDGLGPELEYTYSGSGFNAALLRLAADDAAVRTMLVDGCLARLLRGGRPGDLRPFVVLHDELSVTPAEAGARIADYAALIDATPGTIARLAQRCLRQADDAGLLEVDTLLDVTRAVLRREEKGLVKTQSAWIRQAARRHPQRAAELLAVLDVPSRPDLLTPVPTAAPVVPEMPPPIASATELAEELAALLTGDRSTDTLERVLAGIVTLHAHDRDAVTSALRPVIDGRRERLANPWGGGYWAQLGALLLGLLEPAPTDAASPGIAFGDLLADRTVAQPLLQPKSSPSALLEVRLATIERYLHRSPVPQLVATPTTSNGHLDPAVLVGRLEMAERDGWQPWHADLTQAILRLPREDPGADVVRRARRLSSPAGQAVARQLRDGHRDPVVTAYAQYGNGGRYRWLNPLPDRRIAVAMTPPERGEPAENALFTLVRNEQPQSGWESGQRYWAAALPSHREAVAAWIVASLATAADSRGGVGDTTQMLPLLAESHGPTGPATQLALVYGMTVPDAADRVATLDALLAFGTDVDWAAVGGHLGDCAAAGSLVLSRAVKTLQDTAESGAVGTAWQICAAALPALLAMSKPRAGTIDMLRLAERCARSLGGGQHIGGLDAIARSSGSTEFLKAARALHATVAPIP